MLNVNPAYFITIIITNCHHYFQVTDPPVRQAGVFVDDVQMLIAKLKEKGVLKQ